MTGVYKYFTGDGWPGHTTDILTGETIVVDQDEGEYFHDRLLDVSVIHLLHMDAYEYDQVFGFTFTKYDWLQGENVQIRWANIVQYNDDSQFENFVNNQFSGLDFSLSNSIMLMAELCEVEEIECYIL